MGVHRPLRICADLEAPPVMRNPIYLDALLLYGMGASMGAARADGIEDPALVLSKSLPLLQVFGERQGQWWYAASMALPYGQEQAGYINRRPALELLTQYTTVSRVDIGSGVDKALHIPYYRRYQVMGLTWTCWGDPDRIAPLLMHVHRIGGLSKAHGWIKRWRIDEDVTGPGMEDYGKDVTLRHLPLPMPRPENVPTRVQVMPLTPPYYERVRAVPCLQAWG